MRRLFLSAAVAVLSIAATLPVYAQRSFTQEPFTDVPKTHVNFQAIEYLRVNNILKGYPDGTFRPNRRITRAEFVALITNPFFLSGRSNDCLTVNFRSNDATRVFFTDVLYSAWYAQDVCEAAVNEFVHGYADGTFKPNHNISFVEGAKIAARLFKLDVERDHPADEHWYVIYAQTLSKLRAIPQSIKTFTQTITRGEMAEIVFRLKTSNTTKTSANFESLR